MNNIDELLNKINNKIAEEPCVKEYFHLKSVIEKDNKLMELNEKVRFHQNKMCLNQNDDSIYFREKELYEKYLKEMESNPIYQNFVEIKKEVNAFLIEIRDFLN